MAEYHNNYQEKYLAATPPAHTSSTFGVAEQVPDKTDEKHPLADGAPALPPRYSNGIQAYHERDSIDEGGQSDVDVLESAEPVSPDLPSATHPTVAFAIPFPTVFQPSEKARDKIPPFVLYSPMAAALSKPPENGKESVTRKAMRKWEEEEREAREKGHGFKAKAVKLISKGMSATKNSRIEFLVRTPNKKKLKELRIIYPASYDAEDIKQRFTDLIKKAKSGAIRNGVISTAMLPFILTFDVLTFIAGPFEINAVWAASSWTGAARASAISSRITSERLPVSLSPDMRLDPLSYRLHEICWRKLKKPRSTMELPRWRPEAGPLKRGPDLAGVVLDVIRDQGEDLSELETNKILVSEDLERCLKKGAKEWVKIVES
ncbi:hypothetical protein BKA93DRAFT_753126 [Sparassis latifolia]|uniref:Uncharacterized protein n=1 Tax=Sparassis crispa TaxID=139825 RepID=A0A401H089_9APHY|nr:hypothetical protein SCP_1200240 [Sparassis crispa]GBE87799.1 hypothetical protein SCP_1200240 [Sparassis crispa]